MKRLGLVLSLCIVFAVMPLAMADGLTEAFTAPPGDARPGVYWYFMDGNLNREEMVKDLESMAEVGLGNLVFLEVDVGVPRGPVKFMSEEWQGLFANAVRHAERLGIDITLGAGPGWTGSGGPWVPAEASMQHLVFSTVDAEGPRTFDEVLPVPEQRSTNWHKMGSPFYEDVVIYAFPTCEPVIDDINEKALYERDPYTSKPGVKPYLPAPVGSSERDQSNLIEPENLIDLTERVSPDGRLKWEVPAGEWTILRVGRRSTGASTRPAPAPGVGFDHDKFDKAALEDHFANYYSTLLEKVGPRAERHGWTTVHLDSWEMGAQNWTPRFREEFEKRRGYDPLPYFVTFSGRAVSSVEITERFLWDVRLTAQELVLENYAGHLKTLGREHGFELSIEPYDMNPTADLDLGAVADVPMCEFWSVGYGFDSSFSCIEAASVAHTMGRPIVSAEAFTAGGDERWQQYPWSMKNQGDWAFCIGVNRFVYHTFAHKPLGDAFRPGMTMGPYGVHWDRGQTWWPMVKAYHEYVTRCSHLLRQGVTVSDILYLTPEGAPQVFRAPASALNGSGPLADKKGYGFDGCSPNILMERAEVRDGLIVFPGGTSYRLLVLPRYEAMTPELLEKILQLVEAGAVVYGAPPSASPSLSGYPECDARVKQVAANLWGDPPSAERRVGKGRIILDPGALTTRKAARESLLPDAGNWIWFDRGAPERTADTGKIHFRYRWTLDDLSSIDRASIEATADNAFTLGINGKTVLSGDDFNVVYSADILSELSAEDNTIDVVATNGGDTPNPAGFIAAMRLDYADGTSQVIGSDASWLASRDGTAWSEAKVLGAGNMAPWHLKGGATDRLPTLYPKYDITAGILEDLGIPENFASDGPVRHGHRRTEKRDIYFVANTTDERVAVDCVFRVTGSRPQLWDPVTAEIRGLPQFAQHDKTTTIPMVFEPYQSFFVIFLRDEGSKPETGSSGINFPEVTPVQALEGPWDVAFDPRWGGPEHIVFDTLQDWTAHAERGIKYYSGIATYSKTFELAAQPGTRLYLDLGRVHDIARVSLNGIDLGVVWCAPWRVDITDTLKDGENRLTIDVANRWSNRLLGDQSPPDKDVRTVKWESGLLGGKEYKAGRYTFATSEGPGKLLPSGLLGPVRIQGTRENQER